MTPVWLLEVPGGRRPSLRHDILRALSGAVVSAEKMERPDVRARAEHVRACLCKAKQPKLRCMDLLLPRERWTPAMHMIALSQPPCVGTGVVNLEDLYCEGMENVPPQDIVNERRVRFKELLLSGSLPKVKRRPWRAILSKLAVFGVLGATVTWMTLSWRSWFSDAKRSYGIKSHYA